MYICVFRIKDEGENIENASVRFLFWVTMWCNKLHGEKTNFLCTAFRHAMLGIFVTVKIFFKSIFKSYNRRYLKTVFENVPLILAVNWPRMSFKNFPWIFLICSMKSIVFKEKMYIKMNGSFTVECVWYSSLENCSRRPPIFLSQFIKRLLTLQKLLHMTFLYLWCVYLVIIESISYSCYFYRRDNPLEMLGEHSKSLWITRLRVTVVIYKHSECSRSIPSGLSRR